MLALAVAWAVTAAVAGYWFARARAAEFTADVEPLATNAIGFAAWTSEDDE